MELTLRLLGREVITLSLARSPASYEDAGDEFEEEPEESTEDRPVRSAGGNGDCLLELDPESIDPELGELRATMAAPPFGF